MVVDLPNATLRRVWPLWRGWLLQLVAGPMVSTPLGQRSQPLLTWRSFLSSTMQLVLVLTSPSEPLPAPALLTRFSLGTLTWFKSTLLLPLIHPSWPLLQKLKWIIAHRTVARAAVVRRQRISFLAPPAPLPLMNHFGSCVVPLDPSAAAHSGGGGIPGECIILSLLHQQEGECADGTR
jgi:hypothetical protein